MWDGWMMEGGMVEKIDRWMDECWKDSHVKAS